MRTLLTVAFVLVLASSCGDEPIAESNRLIVFPSPFTHSFFVEVKNQGLDFDLHVFDADGKPILDMHKSAIDSTGTSRMIDARNYPSGKFSVVLDIDNQRIIKTAVKL